MSNLVRLGEKVPDNLLYNYKQARKHARYSINKSLADNLHPALPSAPPNSKAFWKTANNILHRTSPTTLALTLKSNNLSNRQYFINKIDLIPELLPVSLSAPISHYTIPSSDFTLLRLSHFSLATLDEINKLIHSPNETLLLN